MARLIWISLAAGYVMGVVGAFLLMPPSLHGPVLVVAGAVSALAALVTGAIAWRRRRLRAEAVQSSGSNAMSKKSWSLARGLAAIWSALGFELRLVRTADADADAGREVQAAPAAAPAAAAQRIEEERYRSPLSGLSDTLWSSAGTPAAAEKARALPRPAVAASAGRRAQAPAKLPTPAARPVAERAPQRRPSDHSSLRCLTMPIVMLPQRRRLGLAVQGRLQTSASRSVGRAEMIEMKVPRAQVERFDMAVFHRALDMIRRHAADLAGRRVSIEASLHPLADADILAELAALADDPRTRDIEIVLVVGLTKRLTTAGLLDSLPPNLVLALRTADPLRLDPRTLVDAGITEVVVPAASLAAHADLPLEADPIHLRLNAIADSGIRVVVGDVEGEATLLEALDHPVTAATGALFGEPSIILSDGSCTFFAGDTGSVGAAEAPRASRPATAAAPRAVSAR